MSSGKPSRLTMGSTSPPEVPPAVQSEGPDRGENVERRTLHGLRWTATSTVGQQAMQFAFTAVLAHLIAPNQFGLVAMITVFTGFAALFADLGLSPAIVQRPEIEERHLSSALWASLVTGAVATLVVMALAPLVSSFYREPELLALTLAIAPVLLITSLSGVQTALLQRDMNFRRLVLIENVAFAAGNAVAIVMALSGLGAWSLVGLAIVTAVLRTGLLWARSGWRPSLEADRRSLRELWRFGGHFTGFNLVNYWSRNADNLLIGRFLGTNDLAYYSRAYNLMLAPVYLVSSTTSGPMFSSLSRTQGDKQRVRTSYLYALKWVGVISFPCVVILFFVSEPLIRTVFGTEWLPTVPILRILWACALLQCVVQLAGVVFTSQGRTDLMFKLAIVWTGTVVVGFVIGLHWGLTGVAVAYTCCNALNAIPVFVFSGRLIGVSLRDVGRVLVGAGVASTVTGASVWAVERYLKTTVGAPLQLVVGVSAGIAVYLLAVYVLSPSTFQELKRLRA